MAIHQVINRGAFDNDPSAESIRDAYGKAITNFSTYMAKGVDVEGHGAVGDNSTDCTTAIQDAFDDAESKKAPAVYLPAGIYRVSGTITRPNGIALIGIGTNGGYFGSGLVPSPSRISWSGSAGGTMFTWESDHDALHSCPTVGIMFTSINSTTNRCGRFFDIPTDVGVDWGTFWRDCAFNTTDYAIYFGGGVTNGLIDNCRFDQFAEYAIRLNGNDTLNRLSVLGGTADNWAAGSSNVSSGFMFIDGESAAANMKSVVDISNFHFEVNGGFKNTYPNAYTGNDNTATAHYSAADLRGLIRCGINAAAGGGKVQHIISLRDVRISNATGATNQAYSIIQCTDSEATPDADTLDDHRNALALFCWNVRGIQNWSTEHSRLVGAVPAAARWPHENSSPGGSPMQVGSFVFAPSTTVSTERYRVEQFGG